MTAAKRGAENARVPHIHMNALSLLKILAVLIVAHFLVHTWAAQHADNAAVKGLAYVIP